MGSQSGRQANRSSSLVYLRDKFSHSLNREPESEALIPRLFTEDGLSLKQIAAQVGASRVLVRNVLRAAGIDLDEARPSGKLALTGQTPFGWKRDRGRLAPHQAEQKVISQIMKLRHAGHSLHAIARELTRQGVRTKKGGRWHARSISQILECNARLLAKHKRLKPKSTHPHL